MGSCQVKLLTLTQVRFQVSDLDLALTPIAMTPWIGVSCNSAKGHGNSLSELQLTSVDRCAPVASPVRHAQDGLCHEHDSLPTRRDDGTTQLAIAVITQANPKEASLQGNQPK